MLKALGTGAFCSRLPRRVLAASRHAVRLPSSCPLGQTPKKLIAPSRHREKKAFLPSRHVTSRRITPPRRKKVALSPRDARLIHSLADGTRRIVVVLLCGRPLAVPPETLRLIDALVVAWLPGTEGAGVADLLFGYAAATGKLSYAWPRDETQNTRAARSQDPLFPLGAGVELPAARER